MNSGTETGLKTHFVRGVFVTLAVCRAAATALRAADPLSSWNDTAKDPTTGRF